MDFEYDSSNATNEKALESLTLQELRDKGKICVQNENYNEALELYSKAIDIDPNDATFYSNRSFVYLKLKQYFFANKDADTAIAINNYWAKAHFRKAEVYRAVGQYESALVSYGKAISILPTDRCLITAAQKAAKFSTQQNEYERRLPWVGAGIGIIFGVIISLSDHLLTTKPSIKHPALMVLLVFTIAFIGYIIARSIRYYQRLNKRNLLSPPLYYTEESNLNLKEKTENEEIEGNSKSSNHSRYTKAQARMRFKKGKS